jgi:hypothetical protein
MDMTKRREVICTNRDSNVRLLLEPNLATKWNEITIRVNRLYVHRTRWGENVQ